MFFIFLHLIKKKKNRKNKKTHEKSDESDYRLHYITVCPKTNKRLVLQLQHYIQLYSAYATGECLFSGDIDCTEQTSIIAHQR